MANGRNRGSKGDSSRDPGGFIALPWSVVDSPCYAALSHPARSLLMEISRQCVGDNNGWLLASRAYLRKRGWNSARVIDKAKRELLDAGFIFETVKGHRPNKASWYAVTWRALDRNPGYDPGASALFQRGAYRRNAPLSPTRRQGERPIAPTRGKSRVPVVPKAGPIAHSVAAGSSPTVRHHLDMPSQAEACRGEALDPA